MSRNSNCSGENRHILIGGVVVLLSLLPVARELSLIGRSPQAGLLGVMIVEAMVCLAMLGGRIRRRIISIQEWQASLLADALHAGRLDV